MCVAPTTVFLDQKLTKVAGFPSVAKIIPNRAFTPTCLLKDEFAEFLIHLGISHHDHFPGPGYFLLQEER